MQNKLGERIKLKKIFNNGLIWFGAALSIAEIKTGTSFASLGFSKGLLAIVIGHIIGGILLFLSGYIGGLCRKSSMETTKISFGAIGSKFFALINIVQLIGWTGIMIYDGSNAINHIFGIGNWVWCLIIGALIILWIFIGISNIGKINSFAMGALFILTIILSVKIFSSSTVFEKPLEQGLSFGGALELAIAMPLSWLPLISDYTKDCEKPFATTLVSAVTYTLVSIWMYLIGMGLAIFTQETNLSVIILQMGMGVVGLFVIIFSTVTTTFMDAFSAGVSSKTVSNKMNEKLNAVFVTVVGVLGAIFLPLQNIEGFLYFIGSVFAPMIAILLTDYFVLKTDNSQKNFPVSRMIIWFVGFLAYRFFMHFDLAIGSTLMCILFTFLCTCLAFRVKA